MGKSGGKGKGGKGGKRGKKIEQQKGGKVDPLLKTTDQSYAVVLKMLGNGRLVATCYDQDSNGPKVVDRMCHIRGKMRKKIWINVGDIILVSLREFTKDQVSDKADVVHKYTPQEARKLKKLNELPADATIVDTAAAAGELVDGDNPFEFEDEEDSSKEEEEDKDAALDNL